MILHLDTHVVAWLFAGDRARFPARAQAALDHGRLVYSPVVRLELAFLREIGRITEEPVRILDYLRDRIGLTPDATPHLVAVRAAESLAWTRDPFDRLITGAAAAGGHPLLTRDRAIRSHYENAVWDDAV
ncbi:MAG: type II toxin-antitoxin system VapC family toxin [Spirochaetota bacterium]